MPGQGQRCDSQYNRNGTANLFVMLEVHRPWWHVKVTDGGWGESTPLSDDCQVADKFGVIVRIWTIDANLSGC